MDFKESIGDSEVAEYCEIGEIGGPELILSTGHEEDRPWIIYNVPALYLFLKRLDQMGVLKLE